MKLVFICSIFFGFAMSVAAQSIIPLYPTDIPNSKSTPNEEVTDFGCTGCKSSSGFYDFSLSRHQLSAVHESRGLS